MTSHNSHYHGCTVVLFSVLRSVFWALGWSRIRCVWKLASVYSAAGLRNNRYSPKGFKIRGIACKHFSKEYIQTSTQHGRPAVLVWEGGEWVQDEETDRGHCWGGMAEDKQRGRNWGCGNRRIETVKQVLGLRHTISLHFHWRNMGTPSVSLKWCLRFQLWILENGCSWCHCQQPQLCSLSRQGQKLVGKREKGKWNIYGEGFTNLPKVAKGQSHSG